MYRVFGRVFVRVGGGAFFVVSDFFFCMLIDLSGTSLKCLPGGL